MNHSVCCAPAHQEIRDYASDQVIRVREDLYCFLEAGRNYRYLLLGTDRALLIDTGYGVRNPWKQLREITDLPVMLVCTHGDPDHSLGVRWFSQAYISQTDVQRALDFDANLELKKKQLAHMPEKNFSPEAAALYMSRQLSREKFVCIREGDTFDLGDRVIQVIDTPAHTHGSIMLLDRKNRELFAGDNASYDDLWLFPLGVRTPPFSVIRNTYARVAGLGAYFDTVWGAHGPEPLPGTVVREIIETIDDIYVNHQNEEVNTSRFISHMVREGETVYNHYHKHIKLVYTKEQLDEMLRNGLQTET